MSALLKGCPFPPPPKMWAGIMGILLSYCLVFNLSLVLPMGYTSNIHVQYIGQELLYCFYVTARLLKTLNRRRKIFSDLTARIKTILKGLQR